MAFRGLLLHGLITRARLRPFAAAVLSSGLFGLMHVGNEASPLLRRIYALWTFVGGLVFGSAYLHTQGGLLLPIALHFGLNALIFGHSVREVAAKASRRTLACDPPTARARSPTAALAFSSTSPSPSPSPRVPPPRCSMTGSARSR